MCKAEGFIASCRAMNLYGGPHGPLTRAAIKAPTPLHTTPAPTVLLLLFLSADVNPLLPNLLISSTINLLYGVGRNPLSTQA